MADIEVGSVWVRKSDGQKTTIVAAHDSTFAGRGWVVHRGKRITHTERRNFLRKYEPTATVRGENGEEQDDD